MRKTNMEKSLIEAAENATDSSLRNLLVNAAEYISTLNEQLHPEEDLVQVLRDFAYIIDESKDVARLMMLDGEIFKEAADEIEHGRTTITEILESLADIYHTADPAHYQLMNDSWWLIRIEQIFRHLNKEYILAEGK